MKTTFAAALFTCLSMVIGMPGCKGDEAKEGKEAKEGAEGARDGTSSLEISREPARHERLTSKVNTFIGTGGHGHTYPGPSMPFGMVQLGPDTRLDNGDWDGVSGYHYSDKRIYGFSHTHLSGTGIGDYCDILFMPTTGDLRWNNGGDGKPGYGSAFSHDEEAASPGYYGVRLQDYDIQAELTTTVRAGFHRYTFPALPGPAAAAKPARIVIDLVHRDEVLDSSLRFVNDREIEGMRRSRSWAQDQRVYFVARFSAPFEEHGIAVNDALQPGLEATSGKQIKAYVGFGNAPGTVLVKVGISAVSTEGARRNLDDEIPGWSFDSVRAHAERAWERELGKIRVEGGTKDEETTFYTALYHSLLSPNMYMDVDGQYRGRDLKVHPGDGSANYTVFSLWDTFRAEHPLLTIIDRARTTDFIRTFLRQNEQGGRLPVWELSANETDCMIGYHAVPVIADAIMKGIGGFDVEAAFAAMKRSAEEDRNGLASYKVRGYVPAEDEGAGVSKTLEYAYDDWCIAQVAKKLGKSADYARYSERAQAYKHLFDPSTGFMRGRLDGHWFAPFDSYEVNTNYTEANAWQYANFVPQDTDGLIALHGGKEAFGATLDALFGAEQKITGVDQPDLTGMIGQYIQGNEPSHHVAYLYAFAGEPWKTQALVRRVMESFYTSDPAGLIGNDDCGQMSAWYVLSALGFYSVTPGSNQYVIGTPRFPKATITLENGKRFVIRARNVSSNAYYIQGAAFNGRPYPNAFLTHDMVNAGGELTFDMGAAPNVSWGTGPVNEPRTSIDDHVILGVPYVADGERIFKGTTQVSLGSVDAQTSIHYTLDGSPPGASSPRFVGPITLDRTTVLEAVAVRAGLPTSLALTALFNKIPDGWTLTLNAPYVPRYSGGGDLALIDGVRGGPSWQTGRWQGYQGHDLEAIVDLGKVQAIQKVAMGFIQDTRSWILMPKQVEFAVSADGHQFQALGAVKSTTADRDDNVVVADFAPTFSPVSARYVRVRVTGYGLLPAWHAGAGNPSYFFTDEIVIE